MSTNPTSPIVQVGTNISGTTSFIINTTSASTINLPINNAIVYGTIDLISASQSWYQDRHSAVTSRLTQAAEWVRCRHEQTGNWNQDDITGEWDAALRTVYQTAMRDATAGTGTTPTAYPRNYGITWETVGTNLHDTSWEQQWMGAPVRWTGTQRDEWEQRRANLDPKKVEDDLRKALLRQRLKGYNEKPRSNHLGSTVRSLNSDTLFANCTPAEITALQLLRKMLPQEEFRHYLKTGFIRVRGGTSGLLYQVNRHTTVKVWEQGDRIASLCIHLHYDSRTPPTDHIVGKMLMIECDEAEIWKRSNITWLTKDRKRQSLESIGYASEEEKPGAINIVAGENYTVYANAVNQYNIVARI